MNPQLEIFFGDNLQILQTWPDACIDLIYIDPPFNTGHAQQRTNLRTVRDENGDRTGFKGQRYRSEPLHTTSYGDAFDDFAGFIRPRLEQARRILKPQGSLFFHIDYREAHYCKIWLDQLFGRACFINEIIWAYDYGGRSKRKWPAKHDNIFWYAVDPDNYCFNYAAIDRIPYLAPGLVGPEKAKRGKTPTDVWWQTIVSPNGKEKTGYATQKPRAILDRIVKVHSRPGDLLCDFFAGSGTFGESALSLGRSCRLVDNNPQALNTMRQRFAGQNCVWWDSEESEEADY